MDDREDVMVKFLAKLRHSQLMDCSVFVERRANSTPAHLLPRETRQVGMFTCTFINCFEGQIPRCFVALPLIYLLNMKSVLDNLDRL